MTDDTLLKLRNQLDVIDDQIIELLNQRYKITDDVAAYKNTNNIGLTDSGREKEIIKRMQGNSRHPALTDNIQNIYDVIIQATKDIRILNVHQTLEFKKIGFIGLGIMGGSIAKVLKLKNKDTYISVYKRPGSNSPIDSELVDEVVDTLEKLVSQSDLIIIASPIDTVLDYANQLKSFQNKKLIIMDIASVKTAIAAGFEEISSPQIEYIATHPMAGSEKQGNEYASSTLFIHKPWVITPHSKNSKETIDRITAFIRYLGGYELIMPAPVHDKKIADISHIVFLLHTFLFAFAQERNNLDVAGSGFISTTRLASGSPEMHSQIFENNKTNIMQSLNDFVRFIESNHDYENNSLSFFDTIKKERDTYLAK